MDGEIQNTSFFAAEVINHDSNFTGNMKKWQELPKSYQNTDTSGMIWIMQSSSQNSSLRSVTLQIPRELDLVE